MVKTIPNEAPKGIRKDQGFDKDSWTPKTELGRKVKSQEITDIAEIFDKGYKIIEPQIVDMLLPNLESELISVGQSKGKFGGGKRSIWKQTQKKTKEGNKLKFLTFTVVGNKDGYIGIGIGSSKETMPAREKALRKAKVNLIQIKRGCGSWESGGKNDYSIPFEVSGKCGAVKIRLMPAPKGTGLIIENECKKILTLAGIKDVYSKSKKSNTKINLMKACFDALKQLSEMKVDEDYAKKYGIIKGKIE